MVLLRIEQPHVANDPEVAHSGGCHRVPMNAIIFVVTKTGNASVHDRRGHADAIPPCECIGSLHIKRVEEGEYRSRFIVGTAAEHIVDSTYRREIAVLFRGAQRSRGRGRKVCYLPHELKSDLMIGKLDSGCVVVASDSR